LMDADTRVTFPSGRISRREPDLPPEDLGTWPAPQADCRERVYYHEDLVVDSEGYAQVRIRNPHFPRPGGAAAAPLTAVLSWDTRSLPYLVQWKMPGQGTHVLGIEPANCHVEGRPAERSRGTLVTLPPGGRVEYRLKLTLLEE